VRDLGTLGVDNSSPSFISDTGDIIGVADLTSSRHQNPHAILLRNRKRNVEKSDLGALKGDSYSRACRVNSGGQVIRNSECERLCGKRNTIPPSSATAILTHRRNLDRT
jgi:uncharacterized membrane protein